MDSTARQARLKPEFAALYPPLTADIWEPAAEMGARVLLWQLQQRGTAALGTRLMDERSMELNEENLLGIADREFARTVEDGLIEDFGRSSEIRLEEWQKRSILRRGVERLAKALIEQY